MFFELMTVFLFVGLSFTKVSVTTTSSVSNSGMTTATPTVSSKYVTTSPIVSTTNAASVAPTATSVVNSASVPPPEDCPASETPTANSTCFQFNAYLRDREWEEEYLNETSTEYKDLKRKVSDDFCSRFKDVASEVLLPDLSFSKADDGKTNAKGMVCVVFKAGVKNFDMEDAQLNFTTKYTFEATGVTFSEWKAKVGECKKCEGGGGPFVIERVCENTKYSCRGHKYKLQKSEDCVKYCPSASSLEVAAVSNLILAIWISLFFSF